MPLLPSAVERTPSATFVHYLHILRRRLVIFLVPLILAPIIAVVISSRQSTTYQATATVLLNGLNLASSLNGLPTDQSLVSQPDRAATTQASIARAPEVAKIAIRLARIGLTPQALLFDSSVSPESNADLLDFKVRSHVPAVAIKLATAYAQAFTTYSSQLQTGPLQVALNGVSTRLAQLRSTGQQKSALYATLLAKRDQIIAVQTLETSDTVVVQSASEAPQVAPRPKRSALLGFGLGLLIGIGLLFTAEAVDTRVRTDEEIQSALGVPLLARIPPAGKKRRAAPTLSMLDDAASAQAEAIRMLRTSLAFVALKQELHTLLITSPRAEDGKTTTAANLGIAFARSGRDVILCDLDSRKPSLSAAFGSAQRRPGLTDVVLGQTSLEKALNTIDLSGGAFDPKARTLPYGSRPRRPDAEPLKRPSGRLQVLGFGTFTPPDPGEFISTEAVQRLLDQLKERADLVILDSAPILAVGDALMLSTYVDGILAVIRSTNTTRNELAEARRLLSTSPAPTIGFVLTDTAATSSAYGYGYVYGGGTPLETIALEPIEQAKSATNATST